MSAWNFKPVFVPSILDGTKRTTIRAYRVDKRDPKEGDLVPIFTGMRTKQCRRLGTARVLELCPIIIEAGTVKLTYTDSRDVFCWRKPVEEAELTKIALADGFASLAAFWSFFKAPLHGALYRFELQIQAGTQAA